MREVAKNTNKFSLKKVQGMDSEKFLIGNPKPVLLTPQKSIKNVEP